VTERCGEKLQEVGKNSGMLKCMVEKNKSIENNK